jgi:hypothetical protein
MSIRFTKNESYFMVRSKMKVDKRIPIDLLSGFAARLKCTIEGGKERTIRGVNWRISWTNAERLIGKKNVGKSKTLTCKLVVRGKEGNASRFSDVVLKQHSSTIIIPAPIDFDDFKMG